MRPGHPAGLWLVIVVIAAVIVVVIPAVIPMIAVPVAIVVVVVAVIVVAAAVALVGEEESVWQVVRIDVYSGHIPSCIDAVCEGADDAAPACGRHIDLGELAISGAHEAMIRAECVPEESRDRAGGTIGYGHGAATIRAGSVEDREVTLLRAHVAVICIGGVPGPSGDFSLRIDAAGGSAYTGSIDLGDVAIGGAQPAVRDAVSASVVADKRAVWGKAIEGAEVQSRGSGTGNIEDGEIAVAAAHVSVPAIARVVEETGDGPVGIDICAFSSLSCAGARAGSVESGDGNVAAAVGGAHEAVIRIV